MTGETACFVYQFLNNMRRRQVGRYLYLCGCQAVAVNIKHKLTIETVPMIGRMPSNIVPWLSTGKLQRVYMHVHA